MIKKYLFTIMAACHLWATDPTSWFNSGSSRYVYVKHKAAHAIVGLTLTYVAHELGDYRFGLAAALALGILKEIYDERHGGKFRVGDIAWTVGPSIVVAVSLKW